MSDANRWEELRDREAAGDPLSSDDHAFLRQLEAQQPEMARESAAWEDMLSQLAAGRSRVADADLAARALSRARSASTRRDRALRWGAAGLAAAAAVLLWQWGAPGPGERPAPVAVAPAPAPAPAAAPAPAIAPAPAPTPAPSERVAFADPAAILGPNALGGASATVARDGCFHLEGDAGRIASVCATAGTQLAVTSASPTRAQIELKLGRLTATVNHDRAPAGLTFTVATEVATVTALGTIFTVEVARDGRTLTRVDEGVVEVVQGGGRVHVQAGQERVLHESQTPARSRLRTPDPATSQGRAEAARSAGRWGEAVQQYASLIERHPRSPEARVALVAMGDLELDKLGRPRAALRAYDRYLEQPGSLSEEALHGRIRALRKLGRTQEEREAIETYLRRYPAGFHAAQHRAHLRP